MFHRLLLNNVVNQRNFLSNTAESCSRQVTRYLSFLGTVGVGIKKLLLSPPPILKKIAHAKSKEQRTPIVISKTPQYFRRLLPIEGTLTLSTSSQVWQIVLCYEYCKPTIKPLGAKKRVCGIYSTCFTSWFRNF